ncbi:MAG: class I SAM-dependent methyltransferase [Anaerolineae bacterium]|nr:class I SAM-dependent methyltransferase [Anaerolineae bacterium]
MPTFEQIYAKHAADYDRLVEREDHRGNMIEAIREIHPLDGAQVIEFGAGTGRITRQLLPLIKHIRAFDASAHMLSIARARLEETGFTNWSLEVADNAALPVPDASADISIAGWSFGHKTEWTPDRWQQEIGAGVDEMLRVIRPGGSAIILETLGSGSRQPAPPSEVLGAYYDWLENERGFSSTWIRTDYQFESVAEGAELFGFFFGDAMRQLVIDGGSPVVPECTGIWYRKRD